MKCNLHYAFVLNSRRKDLTVDFSSLVLDLFIHKCASLFLNHGLLAILEAGRRQFSNHCAYSLISFKFGALAKFTYLMLVFC